MSVRRGISAKAFSCSVVLAGALAAGGCDREASVPIATGDAVDGAPGTINLDQGWTREIQDQAWFVSFGSRLMPYAWFLHLEQANSGEPFRSDDHLAGMGFLAQHPSANNVDGLPVGFSRDRDEDGIEWVGLTCAACHTGEVHYRGARLRIDGGQGLLDFSAFEDSVIAAMTATAASRQKFDRFARRVVQGDGDASAYDQLKAQLVVRTDALVARQRMNATDVPYGHGRLDAFGQIFNAAAVAFIGEPANRRAPDAPVSYPVLWSAAHLDVVQWNGSAPNAGPGPLVQNATTALAVYGHIDMRADAGARGYASSVNVDNLAKIQNWIYRLKAPQWPEPILGNIAQERARRGAELYSDHCQSCHEISARDDQSRKLKTTLVPVDEIGTDPKMARNFLTRRANSGFLEGRKAAYLTGDRMGAQTATINLVVHAAMGALLRHPIEATHAALKDYHAVYKANIDAHPDYYKARPLDGIWSSAPYLHNGSVPTLHDLLLPPEQRPDAFHVGGREFDAERVGLESGPVENRSRFDTRKPGNDNGGHEYGTTLSQDQRMDLIEFLKTL